MFTMDISLMGRLGRAEISALSLPGHYQTSVTTSRLYFDCAATHRAILGFGIVLTEEASSPRALRLHAFCEIRGKCQPLWPHYIVPRWHADGYVRGPISEEFDDSIGAWIDASDPEEVILPSRVRNGYPPGAVRQVRLRWASRISDSGSVREYHGSVVQNG